MVDQKLGFNNSLFWPQFYDQYRETRQLP